MRLTRRAALAGLGALALPSVAQAIEQTRFPVGISARPIAAFEPRRPDQRRFGALQFRGGLVLSSGHPRFGGRKASPARKPSALPGVTGVEVDLKAGTVRVDGEADRAAVTAAIEDAGYDVVQPA